jgi:NAD+ kinase
LCYAGSQAYLTNLEVFVDNTFVTNVQGDGLLLATPTGSTAYSLAAGGSMVHPSLEGILFTPICPHSLSFRPLVFPDHVQLRVQVPESVRTTELLCSFDGSHHIALMPGDALVVQLCKYPVSMSFYIHTLGVYSIVHDSLNFLVKRSVFTEM